MEPVVRNLRFAIDDGVPPAWHGGRRSVTAFFDNLSVFFPAGERFFMRSVRAHERCVSDPALRRDVRAFHAQEGIHGREHDRYNRFLAARYPVAQMEARVERLLERVRRGVPKRAQLAATCALEHFTAIMARSLLDDPRVLEGAHPTMAALWRWHAAEENEHRAVAFDVFRAAGGTYAERAAVMMAASAIFWAKVLEHQVILMRADGTWLSAGEWRALVRFLLVDPGALRPMARLYFAYFRPTFHPNDVDSDDLLARWRGELAASPVYAVAGAGAAPR
jgi:predicted metal-dependent hydrolase